MTETKLPENEAASAGNFEVLKQRAAELASMHGITAPAEVAVCLGVSEETATRLLESLRGE